MNIMDYIPADTQEKYEFFNHNHAAEIITQAYPNEWLDLLTVLEEFELTLDDITAAGGAETSIPGKFNDALNPKGWKSYKICADLAFRFYEQIPGTKNYDDFPSKESSVAGYLDGIFVDYLKGRIAVDVEWNKKDLAFDGVLQTFRTLYESGVISAGVIITRSAELNGRFKEITTSDGVSVRGKYGTTSTWFGRLLPRIKARQGGGCPILAIGINSACITDLPAVE